MDPKLFDAILVQSKEWLKGNDEMSPVEREHLFMIIEAMRIRRSSGLYSIGNAASDQVEIEVSLSLLTGKYNRQLSEIELMRDRYRSEAVARAESNGKKFNSDISRNLFTNLDEASYEESKRVAKLRELAQVTTNLYYVAKSRLEVLRLINNNPMED